MNMLAKSMQRCRSAPVIRAFAALLALACAVSFGLPLPARADVYDTDVVGASIALSQNERIAEAAPDVSCPYAALMTFDGKILWQRDPNTQVPMASTTKIMNAVVALEMGQLDDVITVSEEAVAEDGTSAFLVPGDQLTLREMLYAMMLPSGNDAAYAIAQHYGQGNAANYVTLMNEKAAELGMASTHYSNVNGLVDEYNYTTANDYLVLARHALQNRTFAEVVATQEYAYYSTERDEQIELENTDVLLGTYEGATGIKTGYTDAAGYCFVGSAQREGVGLISVVFGADSSYERFADTEELLNWGFEHYHYVNLLPAGSVVGQAAATAWLDKTVPVASKADTMTLVFDYDPDLEQVVEIHDRGGSIEQGADMGTVTWLRDGKEVASVELVATQAVNPPTVFESIQIWWYRVTSFFTGRPVGVSQSVELPATFALIGAVS